MTTPATAITSATTTAGLRGAHWNPERLPDGVRMSAHSLITHDGARVNGYLFQRGGERTVVCSMHPRELLVTQYMVPEILAAGHAMWVQGARSVGNDIRLEHESALLDLAAGQQFLRSEGFAKSVLIGNSGGGPLASFYIQQAALSPAARIQRTPAGRPTALDEAELPAPDGLILVSSHLGQGKLLQNAIDPSVIDENDALAVDEALSAFNPKNGFKRPPESASYSSEFLECYRAAQRARVERIDAHARAIVAKRAAARKRNKETPSRADTIAAAHSPIFTVWRTDADPRCFDLSIDPSERAYGTLWGANPIASNYGSVGFARVCTAESWLSNWSGLSSNATMEKCAPDIAPPTLLIEYTGDSSMFPTEVRQLFGWIGAADKTHARVHGNHHGQAIAPDKPNGQIESGRQIREWLAARGFA